jgi:hypothetical protein
MSRAGIWFKVLGAYVTMPTCSPVSANSPSTSGILVSVGGPLFVQSIRPSDDELVKRYNPDLQRRSAEQGQKRAQEFEDYVHKLKEWSKSDKSSTSFPWIKQ